MPPRNTKAETNKKGTDSNPEPEDQSSPQFMRSGALMLMSAQAICDATGKNFKKELQKTFDELKDVISEPGAIERLRKVVKV